LLLHAQLKRFLLLLTLQLMLLQRPRSWVVGAQRRCRSPAKGHHEPPYRWRLP
jgi:hypothetical protein